ncbi:MAG TPA: hypothetical protein VGP37_02470 [Candidatus Nanopelagicales bacterium]|nr:hypothetical protein [Candidatus Nanopelagicales bacterium]
MGTALWNKFRKPSPGTRSEGMVEPPRAVRFRSPRWGDVRLWLGVGLLIASMFVGARVLSQGSDTIAVWQAERDLSVGSQQWALRPVTVALGDASGDYVPVTEQPAGTLRVPVAAGDLLPRSALGTGDQGPTRTVTVGVDPLHAPVGLAPGDVVDIWSTPAADSVIGSSGASLEPTLVLSEVSVEQVGADSLGVGGEMAVVVAVDPQLVADVVRAGRIGAVDLVRVPVDSQVVDPPSDVRAQEAS